MTIEELRVLITAKTEGLQEGIKKSTEKLQRFKKTSDDMSSSNSSNISKMKSNYDSLIKKLDNVNAQAELQQRKLNDLREKYGRMGSIDTDSPKSMKLQEQILSTESKLQKLIDTSDKTVSSIDDLDNKMNGAGESTNKATRNFDSLKDKLQQIKDKFKSTGSEAQRSTGKIAGFASMLNKSFMRILKRIFIFNLIYKMIRGLINYLNGALSTNKQFSSSLNTIKTNLKVAFQPIYDFILPAINALMRGLATLTGYIASFTSAIFGKTYQQSFKAAKGIETAKKQMDKYGGAAKKAGKEAKGALAGFDEINTLDIKDDSDSGSGAGGHELEVPDLTEIDEGPITRLQKLLAEMFKPFKDAWDNEGQNTINAAKGALNSMKELILAIGSSFKEVWTGGSGQDILESLLRILQIVLKTIDGIASAFTKAWNSNDLGTKLIQSIADMLLSILLLIESIGNSWLEVWNNGTGQQIIETILRTLTNVFTLVGDIADAFKTAWDNNEAGTKIIQVIADTFNILLGIVEGVSESLNKVWGEVGQSLANAMIANIKSMVDILKAVAEGLKSIWDNGGQHLFEGLLKLAAKFIELSSYIHTEFVIPFIEWFIGLISPAIGTVLDWVADLLDEFTKLIDWLLGDGKPVLDTIVTVLGSMAIAFGIVKGAILAYKAVMLIATAITTGFGAVMAIVTSPITLVVLAIGAVIAIGVLLYKHWEEISVWMKDLWEGIKEKAEEIWNGIATFFSDTWTNIKGLFSKNQDEIREHDKNTWEEIKKKTEETWNDLKTFLIDKIWNPIKNTAKTIWDGIKKNILDPINQAQTNLTKLWDDIKLYILKKWDEIRQGISNMKNNLIDAIMKPFELADKQIQGVIGNAKNWGKNLISNFIDGINAMIGKVKDAVSNVANTVKDFLGFNSPSKKGPGSEADRWMPNLMNMLADGIEDNVYKVSGAVNVTANALRGVENPNKSLASDVGSAVLGAMQFSNNSNQDQGDTVVEFNIEGEKFARVIIPHLDKEKGRVGNPIIQPI